MKKADKITGHVASTLSGSSGLAAGSTGMRGKKPNDEGANSDRDHIDVINQVFAELELAYHNQYHKAYAKEDSVRVAKKYWLECLSPFSPDIILQATRDVVTSHEYLPSVATIVQGCEDAMSKMGLPSTHDAYVEACCAPHPKAEFEWSHPAVYLAGKETGWFDLANRTEAQAFPLFAEHYRKLCRRALYGEELKIERVEALPEAGSRKLSAEENKERMAALRKQLKS